MHTNETTHRVAVATPSRLRTELNVVAAVVAVGISLVILALLANTPTRGSGHHPPPAAHAQPAAVHAVGRP